MNGALGTVLSEIQTAADSSGLTELLGVQTRLGMPRVGVGDQNSPFPSSSSGCREGEALLCISLARDELQRGRAAARSLQQLLKKVAWGIKSGAEIKISLEMRWPRPQSGCRKLVVIPCS